MELRDTGDNRCDLTWSAVFEPAGVSEDEARKLVEGIYNLGFDGLKKIHGG